MAAWLEGQGHQVNHKRVARLMETMGLEAIYPKPRTSQPSPEHRVYPYLPRGVAIERPDQVWSTNITYIRMARGFVVFDTLLWPTLITGNGPPAMINDGTLSVSGTHARGADAKEESERGAVRGDQEGV